MLSPDLDAGLFTLSDQLRHASGLGDKLLASFSDCLEREEDADYVSNAQERERAVHLDDPLFDLLLG